MKKQAIFKKILVRFASLVIKTKKGNKKLNKMFKINHWRLVRDIIFIPISISLTLLFSAHLIFDMINLSVLIESIFGLIILLICYGSILFYRFMNSNHKIELN